MRQTPELLAPHPLPEFHQPLHAIVGLVASDQAGIDGADRGADDPIRLDPRFMQRLIDARLVRAERAARQERPAAAPVSALPRLASCHARRSAYSTRPACFPPKLRSARPLALVRGPTAIDWQGDAGDRGGGGACEEDSKGAQLFHSGETLVWLLHEQHAADDLFARNAVRLCLPLDLRFDQRGVHVTRTDGVAGDAVF